MDLGILSKQLETLPASGLVVELKNHFHFLDLTYLLFFLVLLFSVFLLPIVFWQATIISIFLFWYCLQLFRRHILLSHPLAINKLVFTELGWCYVQLHNQKIYKADIRSDTILTEHLVILNLTKRDFIFDLKQREHIFYGLMSTIKKHQLFNHSVVILTADRLGCDVFRNVKRHLRLVDFIKILRLKKAEGE